LPALVENHSNACETLRGMMPWISAGKMVDKEKN